VSFVFFTFRHRSDSQNYISLVYQLVVDPDKWKRDSEHGMSREDAENRFKSIQNAYDHLLSNFDD